MSNRNVYITQTSAYLPNAPVDNDNMERILGQAGDKPSRARRMVLRSNGITSRHYAIDPETGASTHTNAQITAEAIRKFNSGFDPLEISFLACGTSIPDQVMPNHAVMVQGELGVPMCEAVATSGVCLSGMTALKYAWFAVGSGQHSSAVATGSDLPSSVMTAENFQGELDAKVEAMEARPEIAFEKDFLRWMLSDGAGAVLLEDKPSDHGTSLRIDWIESFSYAGEIETCMYMGAEKNPDGSIKGWTQMNADERAATSALTIKQDVKLLNENIVNYTVERPLPGLMEKYQMRADQIDHFLPHYSSTFFRDKMYEGMKRVGFDLPQDRWFTNLTSKGNTGAASIYIMLEELLASGKVKPGERLLCFIPESGRFSTCFMHLTAV